MPDKIVLVTPENVAIWVNENARWQQAAQRYTVFTQNSPYMRSYLAKHFAVLADYSDTDFQQLFNLLI